MGDRIALARRYLELQRDGKIDEAVAMLADDVVSSNPMTGTQTGKAAVEAGIRNRPAGGGMQLQWSEPELEGDNVKIVATGAPFGPIKVVLGFNDEDKINRIEVGLAL
ncbi:MAG TPA: nuclear transport factor 2 family protein [Dehalococcoidia bacterium]|nr:nuclear transport factor 2 family protein [Dehalococcoidia bacterium]